MDDFIVIVFEQVSNVDSVSLATKILQLIALIVIIIMNSNTIKNSVYEKTDGRLKDRKDHLERKLSQFYGPMFNLRKQSSELYSLFRESEGKTNDYNFRTIEVLASKKPLKKNSEILLKRIIDLSKKELILIEEENWAITNPAMLELFAEFASHISLLDALYENMKRQDEEKFDEMTISRMKESVFPLKFDGALSSEMHRIKSELNLIEYKLSHKKRVLPRLQKIGEKFVTKDYDYYNKFALDYIDKVDDINLQELYNEVIQASRLKMGMKILDVGCGTGRDTRAFIKKGFRVVSIDAAKKMVEYCNKYPFAYCEERKIQDINYFQEFDLVWANALFVHMSEKEMIKILEKLVSALKEDRFLFLSLKSKNVEKDTRNELHDKRKFCFYDKKEVLAQIIKVYPNLELVESSMNKSRLEGSNDNWINFLFRVKK